MKKECLECPGYNGRCNPCDVCEIDIDSQPSILDEMSDDTGENTLCSDDGFRMWNE